MTRLLTTSNGLLTTVETNPEMKAVVMVSGSPSFMILRVMATCLNRSNA